MPDDARSALTALWDDAPRARPALTRTDLARAAVAVLDDLGFDGLTMRAIAQRLGVKAASLYNHVRDKGDILALVADAVVGEVPRPDPSLPWRARLEAISHAYRAVLLAHRDAARVLAATPPIGPRRLRLIDGARHPAPGGLFRRGRRRRRLGAEYLRHRLRVGQDHAASRAPGGHRAAGRHVVPLAACGPVPQYRRHRRPAARRSHRSTLRVRPELAAGWPRGAARRGRTGTARNPGHDA